MKVFLVEDETAIRQDIRNKVSWEQYGYELVGEASDGEMALPMIRKHRPDLIITDIRMPFMDGLSLSRMVKEEFPNTKIVIISEEDDFECARQAIEIGVERYLLKPITSAKLSLVLQEIKDKMDQSALQHNSLMHYRNELQEYEQFERRHFFEMVLKGQLSASEIYEKAARLRLEIAASGYNLLLLYLQEKEDEILHFFLRNPQYIVVHLNVECYGILVMADWDEIRLMTERSVEYVKDAVKKHGEDFTWYVAVGSPVERLSMLSECYQKVSKCFAYRFMMPKQHVLEENLLAKYDVQEEENSIKRVKSAYMDSEVIREFLQRGSEAEIEHVVKSYMQSVQSALESRMFADYLLLHVRFTTIAYVESLGVTQEQFLEELGYDIGAGVKDLQSYVVQTLKAALSIRDKQRDDQTGRIIRQAVDYINENYMDESLSLHQVAAHVNVSANYFSTVFRQNMRMTFTEYVTKKRMDKAKKLLRSTDTMASEIARIVGYKDAHYFSFVFRKTQGCSPREYRFGKKG